MPNISSRRTCAFAATFIALLLCGILLLWTCRHAPDSDPENAIFVQEAIYHA